MGRMLDRFIGAWTGNAVVDFVKDEREDEQESHIVDS